MQKLVDIDDADPLQRADDAVIVVHGVADQQPGETARAFVEMMVASAPNGARYVAGDQESFTLPVPPMDFRFPGEATSDSDAEAALMAGATPTTRERGLLKAFRQSIKSDFHRPAEGSGEASTAATDRGLAFTRYLLGKSVRNEAPAAHYASQRTRLTRQDTSAAAGPQAIDVYEMYWADQSRLASAMPRIVTELFTMFFRLSRLGRDAVDEASCRTALQGHRARGGWRLLSRLQTIVDWALTNLLAQFFFQLLIVGLYLLVLGAVAPEPGQAGSSENALQRLQYSGVAVFVLALVMAAYFRGTPRMGVALACGAVGGMLVAVPALGFGIGVLALLTTAYFATLRWVGDRFPLVFYSGRVVWTGLVAATLLRVVMDHDFDKPAWDALLIAGLTAFEFVLFAIKWWFIVFGTVIAAWAVLSTVMTFNAWRHKDWQLRGAAATGRLGALVSLATFLLVAMALWAALGNGLGQALKGDCYRPAVWPEELKEAVPFSRKGVEDGVLMLCASGASNQLDAASFAEHRFKSSTETFALNALLLGCVLAYLLMMLVPSLLAELQFVTSGSQAEARRLGRWLTWFYRHLDRVVLGITLVGAVAAVMVAVFFFRGTVPFDVSRLSGVSQTILRWFVVPAASALAVLSVLGGVLSRWAPGLRAPLDAALDVDNYMREFPRRAIPRARIFARYAALLLALRERGYKRIVVVAHSQGTVISAELLRFLSSTSTDRGQTGRTQRLKSLLGCESIDLLTLGCPLRQLYAARFPGLYEWVLNEVLRPNGPCADDVGVDRWFNAFGSGDYVGRWLWSRHVDAFHPLNDGLGHPNALGREMTYDDIRRPPGAGAMRSHRELEVCTGFAAHTHYFDPPHKAAWTPTVALLVDELICP